MRVLVAMSGGVDSSVAAALLREEGHDVVGVTMKLWGGYSDSGCCSVADVEDARRVAQQLGIAHHVFNFTEDFERDVVDPYVSEHAGGRTPNPCVACNRHLKFGRLLGRARVLGFDAVATGHYARVVPSGDGHRLLLRGVDGAKDQSYVVSMLTQDELAMVRFPVGALTKAEVRATAARLGLRTAAKPDSQDVCFISRSGGREAFLGARIPLHPGRLVDGATGEEVGTVDAVELVTVGQRRRLGAASAPGGAVAPGRARRYAVGVDVASATVTLGPAVDLMVGQVAVSGLTWVDAAVASQWCDGRPVEVQCSAHGRPARGVLAARYRADGGPERGVPAGCATVVFDEPQRRVAPGQSVVLYDGEAVLGAGVADGDGGDRRVGP